MVSVSLGDAGMDERKSKGEIYGCCKRGCEGSWCERRGCGGQE